MEIKCFVCGKTDKGSVYLKCIHEGEESSYAHDAFRS